MTVRSPLRVGLAGNGFWAREVHAKGLAAHPGIEFVGVYGRDLANAAHAADPYGVRAYDDFDTFLDQVDVVAFALPPYVQAELALRAAESGKHLLMEKPIALDLGAADRLVAAVEERGLSSVVFFTQRYVTAWEDFLLDAIAAKPLGGRADWLSRQDAGSPYANSVWRRRYGALWDVGPHMLSQLVPALGPVVDIAGSRGVRDLVHLVLTHQGGATSRMSLSLTMPAGTVRVGVEFWAEGGWLVQPEDQRDLGPAYARMVSELIANIDAGETRHRCDVRFGRDVVEILTRCEAVLDRR
ncbi:MAG: oxidoreductase domain protein [Marmoricola sp.]|nr:oxidoreductase domain protein [Marmoricola sp.]